MPEKTHIVRVREGLWNQMLAIQRDCRKKKKVVPSIPFLVDKMIDLALPAVIKEIMH